MRSMRFSTLLPALSVALLLLGAHPSWAEPTRLVVRVLAHDAKLIGDAAGGARVVVFDAESGVRLAEGMHLGGTGSTAKIIKDPQVRGESIYDTEGAASFVCELDLDEPTWVRVEATAPMAYPQSRAQASSTLIVVPGRHLENDGLVLELNGLIVNLLQPHPETKLHAGDTIEVEAGVKLLCTCPIFEGSLWDAKDYWVEAQLWSRGEMLETVDLEISEIQNVFAGRLELPSSEGGKPITAELRIVAGNDAQHNFGIDRAVFKIAE
jgi:hypothetical protein